MDSISFKKSLAKIGLNLTEKNLSDFSLFLDLLKSENKKYNLTAIIKDEEIYEKHFFDSLTILSKIEFSSQKILDVGTGAGFPSVPLKIVFPKLDVTALDSNKKKVQFLNLVSQNLNFKNFFPVHERAEVHSNENRGFYDLVLTRATGPLPVVLEISAASLKTGGLLVAWKSSKVDDDILASYRACKTLNLELIEKQCVVLPFSCAKRYNLIYKKVGNTPSKYPRSYSKIKKNPLWKENMHDTNYFNYQPKGRSW